MRDAIFDLLSAEYGHFELESGYHASMWLNLETLFVDASRIDPLAAELARRLSRHNAEVVCGPLTEGAFLALFVAKILGLPFTYSERGERTADALYPYGYALPKGLRQIVRGKRVAIVNDVISAGSAVRGTAADLAQCGATVTAIGALLVLGDWTKQFTAANGIALEALTESPFELAAPDECRQCKSGVAVERRVQAT